MNIFLIFMLVLLVAEIRWDAWNKTLKSVPGWIIVSFFTGLICAPLGWALFALCVAVNAMKLIFSLVAKPIRAATARNRERQGTKLRTEHGVWLHDPKRLAMEDCKRELMGDVAYSLANSRWSPKFKCHS